MLDILEEQEISFELCELLMKDRQYEIALWLMSEMLKDAQLTSYEDGFERGKDYGYSEGWADGHYEGYIDASAEHQGV